MIFIGLILLVLVLGYMGVAHILPEMYWFESVGYLHTYFIQLGYKVGVFVAIFLVVYMVYSLNDRLTTIGINRLKKVPPDGRFRAIFQAVTRIMMQWFNAYIPHAFRVSSRRRWVALLVVSCLVAQWGASDWSDMVRMFYAPSFGVSDPVFGRDVSFYALILPVVQRMIRLSQFVLITSLVFSIFRYMYHDVMGVFFTIRHSWLRWHALGILSMLFVVSALSAYMAKFDILVKYNRVITGPGYTDIHVYLSAIKRLPLLWLALAILCLYLIIRLSYGWVIGGVVGMVGYYLIALSLIPTLVQNYVVAPNEFERETPYIQRNIQYTQQAYGLDAIQNVDVTYQKSPNMNDPRGFEAVLNHARLWNAGPLKSTLKQLQEIRSYYEFQTIDVDRYTIQGSPQQVMVSAREIDINQLSQEAQTWVNRHLIFTHGYGLCMVPVNQFNSEGLPELFIRDIPPVSLVNIDIDRPELYFGESTHHYVLVNTHQKEFDYPKDNENRYTHYTGDGGVIMDSLFKRLVYAIKFRDIKLLISQNIHKESRLMFDRTVRVIPQKIAPFITYDGDPYLVVHNGRLVWMLDGYTSSNRYPYATPYSRDINYVRNAVLVTVDAYSGETIFYMKDDQDPIVLAYHAMYPRLFQSMDTMPDGIKQHQRFPKDLFAVVTKMHSTYHMTNPQVFYNKEDVWAFSKETYDAQTGVVMDPYYMFFTNQQANRNEYVIMMPLTPANKNNLVSIMMASCEPDNFGQLTVYRYPKQETVYGPLQIESRIDQNTDISKDLTLWGQVGSRVIRGNVMVIPYNDSIFYVEPIYLQATQSQLPELKRVILAAGDTVIMAPSVLSAIQQLTGTTEGSPVDALPLDDNQSFKQKIITIYHDIKNRLNDGDWINVGRGLDRLDQFIRQVSVDDE